MLSRKYYNKIAEILRTSQDKVQIINKIAQFFETDNSSFDMNRFKIACGLINER